MSGTEQGERREDYVSQRHLAATTEYERQVTTSTGVQFEEPRLVPELARLLAEGRPVSIEQLAAAGGWNVEQVRRSLSRQPSVEWDEQQRLVGFGLTLRPTPHKFIFDDRTVYGWCATDVLVFPVVLGKPGIAESRCPETGRLIRAELTPDAVVRVDPPEAVVSEVRPTETVADVRVAMCNLGHFFSSRDAAEAWLAQHPEGRLNSVVEDFNIHRQAMVELGWAEKTRR